MFNKIVIGSFAALLLASCADETPAPDAAEFRQLNEQLVAAVDMHQTNADAMTDMAVCTSERDRYEAEARPIVTEMQEMSEDMDDCMMAMGRDSMADMQTNCARMSDELDAHMGAECQSGNLDQELAEIKRHCDAMRQMAQQNMGRTDNMMEEGGMMSDMMSKGTCRD